MWRHVTVKLLVKGYGGLSGGVLRFSPKARRRAVLVGELIGGQ